MRGRGKGSQRARAPWVRGAAVRHAGQPLREALRWPVIGHSRRALLPGSRRDLQCNTGGPSIAGCATFRNRGPGVRVGVIVTVTVGGVAQGLDALRAAPAAPGPPKSEC